MINQKYNTNVQEYDLSFSTGSYGQQANGCVIVQNGETSVLVSTTAAKKVSKGQDFFPLTVDYREKFSAAGRFPGGFFKREGKPSEKEVLTSRLCDRPLRPLFPKGFINEVQVIAFLLSTDLKQEPDILVVNGASAALMCSDIPWNGPIACVRLAEVNGEFIINPTNDQLFESSIDLIYVGNQKDMLMIEGSADQMPEARFIEALEFAHKAIQPILTAQIELAAKINKPKREFPLYNVNQDMLNSCKQSFYDKLTKAVFDQDKLSSENQIESIFEEAKSFLEAKSNEDLDENEVKLVFEELISEIYRDNILSKGLRVDGRKIDELRVLKAEIGLLPRVHGSAVFERGETQCLVTTTLGGTRDSQDLDGLTGGAQSKSFILHYNFPPFSVGETGRIGMISRREIGHGALAERALLPIIPPETEFPYSIRLVSDVLSSNGSTSMASICGGTLALMDAGVPIVSPVAGISLGLVTKFDESGRLEKYSLLTDIIGKEDHFGDMDFKIAGTKDGITGFQLDLKIGGLPIEIAKEAIMKNHENRLKILDFMSTQMPESRKTLKETAPRIHQMKIDSEKIGALIGPGGKNIKKITEKTGAQIDINDDNSGNLTVFAQDQQSLQNAIREIESFTAEIEPGKVYRGIIRNIKDFGVFVECLPGKDGLVHVSELAEGRVNHPQDVCKLGNELLVKCIGIDDKGRVKLSAKAVKQS